MNDMLDSTIFEILRECQRATAKELVHAFGGRGISVDRSQVNSRLYTLNAQGLVHKSSDQVPVWSVPTVEHSSLSSHDATAIDCTQNETTSITWRPVQHDIITAPVNARLLVEAAPGTGKTAVACARVGHLLQQGHTAGCIHLVSFTRTAVAEIRDRIVAMVGDEAKARSVKISTLDSRAWRLLHGFEENTERVFGSYDDNIEQVLRLLRKGKDEVLSFIERIEHLVVDEAQDLTGIRGEVVTELIRRLSPDCGVTIFADSAQAIYGFTTDEDDGIAQTEPFLHTVDIAQFEKKELFELFRTRSASLREFYARIRAMIPRNGHAGKGLDTVHTLIISAAEAQVQTIDQVPASDDTLVLYRRRIDALLESSYLSAAGTQHRLRLSGLPVVVRPWAGWLFAEVDPHQELDKANFFALWENRSSAAPALFDGINPEEVFTLIRRYASGGKGKIDIVKLREVLGRASPPIEFCYRELGSIGPTLATIHASKGREANHVWLDVSYQDGDHERDSDEEEECRVAYVAATRARQKFGVINGEKQRDGAKLDSGRAYRFGRKAQIEIGRAGDIDVYSQVTKAVHQDASGVRSVQEWLATNPVGSKFIAKQINKRYRLLPDNESEVVGLLSSSVDEDVRKIMLMRFHLDMVPFIVPHIYLVAVGTGVMTSEHWKERAHEPWSRSGFFLIPIVKAFAPVIAPRRQKS